MKTLAIELLNLVLVNCRQHESDMASRELEMGLDDIDNEALKTIILSCLEDLRKEVTS